MSDVKRTTPSRTGDSWSAIARVARARAALEPLTPSDDVPVASVGQESLWLLCQLDPGDPRFHTNISLRITGNLDQVALERALDGIMRRHEPLRTRFEAPEGVPRPVIVGAVPVPLSCTEVRDEAAAREEAQREMRRPLDLGTAPLCRMRLIRFGARAHILVVTIHHIVSDGVSLRLLHSELIEQYRAASEGRPARLAPLATSYSTWASWQRSRDTSADRAAWRQSFEGFGGPVSIPADRPRPVRLSPEAAVEWRTLPESLTGELRTRTKEAGVTVHAAILAAWYLVLHQYTGETDLAVGCLTPNRGHSETRNLIGLFFNTLPIRLRLDRDESVREFVRRVHAATFDSYARENLPIDEIVRAVRPARAYGQNPLFRVLFDFQKPRLPAVTAAGVTFEVLPLRRGTLIHDIVLDVVESPRDVQIGLEYRTDVYLQGTAGRIARQVVEVLRGIASDPDASVDELLRVTPDERAAVLSRFTTAPIPALCIHQQVERQAKKTPDAVAVVDHAGSLTYRALEEGANGLAQELVARGVTRGQLVPVVASGGHEVPVAFYGIMKAGAAFVPIDSRWPALRIRSALEQIAADLVVTDAESREVAGQAGATCIVVDSRLQRAAVGPEREVGGDDPIYVMFTSGSTGQPKGVMVPHRGIANRFAWMDRVFGVGAEIVAAQTTHHAYDSAVWQLFWPLTSGGRTVTGALSQISSAAEFSRLVGDHGVTVMDFVPSILAEIVPALIADDRLVARAANLRHMIVGGEEIRAAAVRLVLSALPQLRAWNLYGPTEASIGCVYHEVARDGGEPIPIGRPISNVRTVILDDAGRLVPDGVAGELWLGGPGLAIGYVADAKATAAGFRPNPFPELGVDRLYRTGDRARYDAEGNILYLGRVDRQVQLRGVRVEPQEIEATIRLHEGVRDVGVGVGEGRAGPYLGARVVLEPGRQMTAMDLTGFLEARLPPQLVPSVITFCERLPRLPSGKLDRTPPPPHSAQLVPPRTTLEKRIADVWAVLLGISSIGVHDDFFALGGHSLLIARLAARLRAELGVEVSLDALFRLRTVEAQSQMIERLREPPLAERIPRTSDDGPIECSHQQRRLWFLEQLHPAAYHIQMVRRLRGPLNVDALSRAFTAVVDRHDALRAQFSEVDGRVVQRIRASGGWQLQVEIDPADSDVGARVRGEVTRPFDLGAEHLLRARLLRLAEDDWLLIVVVHHLVCDGWSLSNLRGELSDAYAAYLEEREPELPALPLRYVDYAAWQAERVASGQLDEQIANDAARLAGAPPLLPLPLDRARRRVQSFEGARQAFTVRPETAEGLRALATQNGTTLFTVLLAAFGAFLHRYTGEEDIVMGVPTANRDRLELEKLVGNFANTLVVRYRIQSDLRFAQLLARAHAEIVEAQARADVPFERVVDSLKLPRDLGANPVFQVMVSIENQPRAELHLPRIAVSPVVIERGVSQVDLALHVMEADGELRCWFEYCTALFEPASIERAARHFQEVLTSIVAAPTATIGELELCTPTERRQALEMWADTAGPFPQAQTIVERFEEQCRRGPEGVAIVCGKERVSYGRLSQWSDQLSRMLRASGVARGEPVVVSLPRSAELVAAALAVLKAGGAYVPVDPSWPDERIRSVVADTEARVLVAESSPPWCAGNHVVVVAPNCPPYNSPVAALQESAGPHDVAYIIFTSGSSGSPKGVAIRHLSVLNLIDAVGDALQADHRDVWTCCHAPSFDFSVFEIWGALLTGGRLVMVPDSTSRQADDLVGLLAQERATIVSQTPSALGMLLDAFARTRGAEGARAIRALVVGGEALPSTLARQALDQALPIWNFYGPTEATVWASFQPVRREDLGSDPVPIGRAMRNVRLYVLDARHEPVPVGVVGELYISGVGLAVGYWKQAELTAERFVIARTVPGERLYRTGDRAKYLPDGRIVVLGRSDSQIKLRGHRIELEEIEAVLHRHSAVRHAAVACKTDVLVGYVVPVDAPPTVDDLRSHLARWLPSYMVPTRFVFMDRLPLTRSAKVDRRALAGTGNEAVPGTAPRTAAEAEVAAVFAEILDLPAVGIRDDFFALGGHSISATRVVARLRELFRCDLTVRSIFEDPTIEGMVHTLARAWGDTAIVEEMASVLQEVRRMSLEEVARALKGSE